MSAATWSFHCFLGALGGQRQPSGRSAHRRCFGRWESSMRHTWPNHWRQFHCIRFPTVCCCLQRWQIVSLRRRSRRLTPRIWRRQLVCKTSSSAFVSVQQGGDSSVCDGCLLYCCSPSSLSYEDTYNTLRYANRAKEIKVEVIMFLDNRSSLAGERLWWPQTITATKKCPWWPHARPWRPNCDGHKQWRPHARPRRP